MTSECEVPEFTFGWEFESCGVAMRELKDTIVAHDGSVSGRGMEYKVTRAAAWDLGRSLAALRNVVTSPGIVVDKSCGFHVHVGIKGRTRKLQQWAACFATLARLVESHAFRAVPSSRDGNQYCRKWNEFSGSILDRSYSPSKTSNSIRYSWANPVEVFRPGGIRTMEVRLMGHSRSFPYLLAWSSFCHLMAASAWRVMLDPSVLHEESQGLISALLLIENACKNNVALGDRLLAIRNLARRAGFYKEDEGTLTRLAAVEKKIRIAGDSDAQGREEYELQIDKMRTVIRVEGESVLLLTVKPRPGDFVRALVADPDHGIVPGVIYKVLRSPESSDSSSSIMVALPNGALLEGRGWNVPQWCVAFHSRAEERVSISVD